MLYLEGQVGDQEITIAVDGDNKPGLLRIRLVDPLNVVLIDREYPNVRLLSSDLACEIGYGPACDFLHAHKVPRESGLWFLNHGGWSPPAPETAAEDKIAPDDESSSPIP